MESITIKVDPQMAKAIEKAMKPLYSTKTEFIREAIRDKIEEQRKNELKQILKENFGRFKDIKTSDEDLKKIKKEVFEEYIKEKGWKLD